MWDLVPWPRIQPGPPALGVWNLSHQTTSEVPGGFFRGLQKSINWLKWRDVIGIIINFRAVPPFSNKFAQIIHPFDQTWFFFLASFKVSLIAYTIWIQNTTNSGRKEKHRERNIHFKNMYKVEESFKIILFCKYRDNTKDRKLTSAVFVQWVQGWVLLWKNNA